MDHSPEKFLTLKEPAPPEFPVWESRLVTRLGLSRNRLLELRGANLVEGVDWIKKSRRVCLTLEAVGKLEASIGLHDKNAPQIGVSALVEPPAKRVFKFTVWRKQVSHPHLLLATDGTNIFRVIVKTKTNFIPGMEIQCEHERLDLFNHLGNCPRFRGKY